MRKAGVLASVVPVQKHIVDRRCDDRGGRYVVELKMRRRWGRSAGRRWRLGRQIKFAWMPGKVPDDRYTEICGENGKGSLQDPSV